MSARQTLCYATRVKSDKASACPLFIILHVHACMNKCMCVCMCVYRMNATFDISMTLLKSTTTTAAATNANDDAQLI